MAADNENDPNDPLPFIQLGALTLNVLNYLSPRAPKQDERGADDRNSEKRSKCREESDREYIEQRERELREFESHARGERRRPRRGGPER